MVLACLGAVAPEAHAVAPEAPLAQEPIVPIPAPPEQDPRRLALGERMFHDVRLSHNKRYSCASCHDPETNGASALAHDLTPDGKPIALNTPTVFNAATNFRLDWEGKIRTLDEHFLETLGNPDTMASSPEEVMGRLRGDPEVVVAFVDAYGRSPELADVSDALAVYGKSLATPGSRFDRWLTGDTEALSAQELNGYLLFKSLGCISCHQGVNVGGNLFQRHGIFHPLAAPEPRVLRVPSLRNVAVTPPYFHDGSAATLPEAVRAMARAQLDRVLSDEQTAAIVAFLETLTGTYRGRPLRPAGAASTVSQ